MLFSDLTAWLALFGLIGIVSLVLTLRSMRSFNELGKNLVPQGLFLVRNQGEFNEETLKRLHEWAASQNIFVSIERLFKGNEQALTFYGPLELPEQFPELDLLELEDYLTPTSAIGSHVSVSKIGPKQILGFTLPLSSSLGFIRASFLDDLELLTGEQFFWQLLLKSVPLPKGDPTPEQLTPQFEIIARTLMVAENAQKRVDLARKILPKIQSDFGLPEQPKPQNSTSIFDWYYNRSFETIDSKNYYLNCQEILALLDLE